MNALELFNTLKAQGIFGSFDCEWSDNLMRTGTTVLLGHLFNDSLDRVDASIEWFNGGESDGCLNICFWNLDFGGHEDFYFSVQETMLGFKIAGTEIFFNWSDVIYFEEDN